MEIPERRKEIQEGPVEITIENVQYWSHHTQSFAQSQIHKAKKFVEHGCYEYVKDGFFRCGPIEGYNTRTYTIRKESNGEFECNCQKGKEGAGKCAHVLGLYYAFKIGYFRR